MKRPGIIKWGILSLLLIVPGLFLFAQTPSFLHPGIDQNSADLSLLKRLITEGRSPYKEAFLRLKSEADKGYAVQSHTRVMRGPYGKPNIGGEDLRISANMAYNNALVWYITGEKKYADNAIAIINAWTPVLWDFDFNDAKLIAALTGSVWCNAAEILKYTPSGWKQEDMTAFKKMLMTVYYPLLRFYFPTANGNWNGGIIQTILAIAIFTDDRLMFNNAIDHFLHSPANGSLFKYIYPSGQCQESPRDQGHVQMGLGLFAGAAQIAFTQGIDFFTIGQNRIAKGFEFTASYMMGQEPPCYCVISNDKRNQLRDDYEYVYRHYENIGVSLPMTKKVADSIRPLNARSVLTAVRSPQSFKAMVPNMKGKSTLYGLRHFAGAKEEQLAPISGAVIEILPGSSVQLALNTAAAEGKSVLLRSGVHKIKETLKIPSNTRLFGEGKKTILFLDPASGLRDAVTNEQPDMHHVLISNLVIEVSDRVDIPSDPNSYRSRNARYNRGGILFHALKEGQMRNIILQDLTVRNASFNGVFISGADSVVVKGCNFDENGGNVVPGPMLQHNLLITHSTNVLVADSRLTTSPFGAGISIDQCRLVTLQDNEIARNGYYGVLIAESEQIQLKGNLIEANDRSGIMMEYLFSGNKKVGVTQNLIQFNAGWAVESYHSAHLLLKDNEVSLNGSKVEQVMVSGEKKLMIPGLKN